MVQEIRINSNKRLGKWVPLFFPVVLCNNNNSVFLHLNSKASSVICASQDYSVCASIVVSSKLILGPFDIWSDLWFCLLQIVGCGFSPVMLNKMFVTVFFFFQCDILAPTPLFSPLTSHQYHHLSTHNATHNPKHAIQNCIKCTCILFCSKGNILY